MMRKILHLFDFFEIKYFCSGPLLVSSCPVHDGDNPMAFNINIDENSPYYGKWFCNTKKCHEVHDSNIMGLIEAIIHNKDIKKDIKSFCKDFDSKTNLTKTIKPLKIKSQETQKKIDRKTVRKHLIFPAQKYLDLDFSEDILNEFDVGICLNPKAQMYNRVVFPVYDEDDIYMVGCVGRTLNEDYSKWKNKQGFNKSQYLYGYNKARQYVKHESIIVLVEGQGDVLRMHQAGINNSVGLFGSKISDFQEFIIQTSGAQKIVIITDNDEAGEKCRKDIRKKMEQNYEIIDLYSTKNDIQDMSVEQVKNHIKRKIDKI